jgi:uncharacterized phage-like protein YoqJ
MIVAFTGHRPTKVGGYKIPNPMYSFVRTEIERILTELKPNKAISGVALGVDQWAAEVCITLDIPFVAAVPFRGQELYWPKESQIKYCDLLGQADKIEYVSQGGFASWKMQARNVWMVDNSDILIAVFDGSNGGTKNCFDYATAKGKKIIRINPLDFKEK